MTRESRTLRSPLRDGIVNLVLLLVATVWLLPYLWMRSTSFQTLPAIVTVQKVRSRKNRFRSVWRCPRATPSPS